MKILSALLLALALVAGVTGSAMAYRHASAPTALVAAPAPKAGAHRPAAQVVRPGTRFKWAPCPAGSRLEGRACVTDVVRTVVIPAPAAPVVARTAPVAAPAAAHAVAHAPVAHGDDGGGGGGGEHGDDGGEDGGGGGEHDD